MPSLRRSIWVAHAWLLAALTPAAGLPHRQCVCPDGGVKWFCLRSSDDLTCCCGSICCVAGRAGADRPAPVAPCCCCQHRDRTPAGGMRETPCRKSWQPSSVVADRRTRDPGPAKVAESHALQSAIPAETERAPSGTGEPVRRSNRAPPPSDRILLFQRLLL
jgi:hypothetical protein